MTTDVLALIIEAHWRGRVRPAFLLSDEEADMRKSIKEHELLKPKSSKAETKADITDLAARAIIGAEAERREAKTAKLRQARMEAEAKLSASPALANKPRRMKSSTPRHSRSSV
ncbi:hypothetical protein [Mesorhizobium sp. GR13]|uniref:hypothetical protein n=1 Tax=Mesorhizobium sp. GR13 TaxID=2562308 RepID=UPI001484D386|nr:hypothetical protein [Mesorhizobium sp. GR13]